MHGYQKPGAPDPRDAPDGAYANVFVPCIHGRYTALVTWAKTADRRKWKYGKSSTGADGIWISYDVWDEHSDRRGMQRLRVPA